MTFPTLTERRCCDIHDSSCHKHTCHKHTLGAVICCHAICHSAVRRLNSGVFTCTWEMVTGASGLWVGIVRDTCVFAHCMIQMEVMGTPGVLGWLHLTSRVFLSACNGAGDVYCKYREKGINLQRDPYFVTKAHLELWPFCPIYVHAKDCG